MLSADGVVYASPLYGWGFAGQMKLFLDRHFCLVNGYGTPAHHSALAGRRAVLLVTCAGAENVNADLIKDVFDRFCHYAVLENRGKHVLPARSGVDAERVRAIVSTVADSILA
jgi:multimeric flavodoxin WrbA